MARNTLAINGVTYELVQTEDKDECIGCDLHFKCQECAEALCVLFFDAEKGTHFEKKE